MSNVTEGSAEGPGGSLGDFCTAASYNMYPYPMNTLSGWIESTTIQTTGNNGHPQDWANDTSCPASIRSGSFTETITLTGIANQPRSMFTQDGTTGGTTEKGYSAISVKLTYVYNNVLPFLLGKSRTFTAMAAARPRSNIIIPCTYTSGSTISPCPGVY